MTRLMKRTSCSTSHFSHAFAILWPFLNPNFIQNVFHPVCPLAGSSCCASRKHEGEGHHTLSLALGHLQPCHHILSNCFSCNWRQLNTCRMPFCIYMSSQTPTTGWLSQGAGLIMHGHGQLWHHQHMTCWCSFSCTICFNAEQNWDTRKNNFVQTVFVTGFGSFQVHWSCVMI